MSQLLLYQHPCNTQAIANKRQPDISSCEAPLLQAKSGVAVPCDIVFRCGSSGALQKYDECLHVPNPVYRCYSRLLLGASCIREDMGSHGGGWCGSQHRSFFRLVDLWRTESFESEYHPARWRWRCSPNPVSYYFSKQHTSREEEKSSARP